MTSPKKGKVRAALIVAFAVVLSAGLGWFVVRHLAGAPTIRHVVLISIDTCRADFISCYGYGMKTTPNIDALADEGVLFENAISPIPFTLPAHCSMLTGTIPPYHGVIVVVKRQWDTRKNTLNLIE